MKTCAQCLEDKPVLEFHKNRAAKDGLQRFCKECHSAKNTEWLRANYDVEGPKRRAYRIGYHAENRDQELGKLRAYYLVNYDKYYEKMAWRAVLKRKATPVWADRIKIKEIYSKAAKMRASGISVDVDHIIPIAGKLVCGLHVHNNLQIIKSFDNRSKSNKFEIT